MCFQYYFYVLANFVVDLNKLRLFEKNKSQLNKWLTTLGSRQVCGVIFLD